MDDATPMGPSSEDSTGTKSLLIHPAPLVVPDPWEHARRFFTTDESSAYDAYITTGTSPRDAVVMEDVVAINTSMRARSPHRDWQTIVDAGPLPELSMVDPAWDLFALPDEMWEREDVPALLQALFARVIGPGIGISRATKVLHIKRPLLIPVCDAYVLRLLGIPGDDARAGTAAVVQLRLQRTELMQRLLELQRRLEEEVGVTRSLVRIADVLIWGSHPDTWMAHA
jgi:hypothetical protein